MKTTGNRIKIKPAQESDQRNIYIWLAQSDLTSSMIGPPYYPDNPIPSWEEFCEDYTLSFFNASGDGKGRNFIITINNEEVGTVGYDLLDEEKDRVVLDIWMKSENYCGHGYGSYALGVLCDYIYKKYGITNFIISPSARNKRAIAAYKKAGFEVIKTLTKEEQEKEFGLSEYDDNILMIKRLTTNPYSGTFSSLRSPKVR